MGRSHECSLKAESGPQVTASKKTGTSVLQLEELNSANNLRAWKRNLSYRKEDSPADALSTGL